jgi:1-aminocyclopropane-1-carboxylate deaminase/D-cysteine desulfhydrase-like pyridoxal-dependent ACC family enzyme
MALGRFPTPVQRMDNLGQRLSCENLYVKRDDLSGQTYGGNKVRKLEFVLADALGRSRNPVITMGAVGSNHVLATTIYGKKAGLDTIGVFMSQPIQEYVRTNILCNAMQGCKIEYVASPFELVPRCLTIYIREWSKNRCRPYLLQAGGSSPLGILGYVEASLEIADQVRHGLLPEPEFIFVPVGSGGTLAGLVLGLKLSGIMSTPVGVRVYSKTIANQKVISFMATRTLRYLRRFDRSIPALNISSREIVMLHDYYGPGYAHYTRKGLRAIELLRDLEGIKLEGTYSGKAMAAFIDFMSLPARSKKPALFIDTYNSIPLDLLLEGCPGQEILPEAIREYFRNEIAPVSG